MSEFLGQTNLLIGQAKIVSDCPTGQMVHMCTHRAANKYAIYKIVHEFDANSAVLNLFNFLQIPHNSGLEILKKEHLKSVIYISWTNK